MSVKHPIISITGSSGAGTTTVKKAFEDIFRREKVKPAVIEGDSFHRYNRVEMKQMIAQADREGKTLSHFGPDANIFDKLEELFRVYSQTGMGNRRYYLHNEAEAEPYGQEPGTFTELFYEGLHGGVVTKDANVAQWVDLLIGVVPSVNLEWIQKISRDVKERGYSTEAVTHTILRRMPDYVNCITPQFSRTHINFQWIPLTHSLLVKFRLPMKVWW